MDLCIIFNTITFMLYYARAPEDYIKTLDNLNYFFISIFFFEILSKIFLYRFRFIKNPNIELLNLFEIFLLISSILAVIVNEI